MQLSLTQLPLQVWIVLVLCVVVWFWMKKRATGISPYERRSTRSLWAEAGTYGHYRYPQQQQHKSSGGLTLIVFILLLIVLLYLTWPVLSKSVHLPTFQGVPQQLAGRSASDSVVGSPTVTPELMNTVLAQAKSPAQGLGLILYNLGVQSGINPAYALAFFHIESNYGTQGVARYTHSIGNIKCTPGWPQCLDGFRSYPTWGAGALDWYKVMHDVYLSAGRDTLSRIVPVYAPSGSNDDAGYIQSVRADVARWKQGQV
jgi:hypothetical protein